MKKKSSDFYQETYYFDTLDNGLKVYLHPKKDFYGTIAYLIVKYGSIDSEFIPSGQNEFVKVPYGIAHFLEHKMFEMPDNSNVTDMFASIGAEVNAYTSYEYTTYYTSTVKNFNSALNLLLDLVQTKGYTIESVTKEMGIIEQELLMYLDDPDDRLYNARLDTLLKSHPAKIDIGGTTSSIKEITIDHLDLCYDTFYHPSNMSLVVVGNFEEDEILNLVKENQAKKSFLPRTEIIRKQFLEDNSINTKEKTLTMDINIPKVSVNIKIGSQALSSEEIEIKKLALVYLLYQEFRSSSEFYQQLLKEEIIDDSFNYFVVLDEDFGYLSISSNTEKVDEFISRVKERLLSLKTIEVSTEHFERYFKIKKSVAIRKLDFIDNIAEMHVDSFIDGIEFFDGLDIINKVKYEDVLDVRKYFNEESLTTVIIKNDEKEEL